MKNTVLIAFSALLASPFLAIAPSQAQEKQPIKAIYIPLADHYAGIVAYEKYRDEMKAADYTIERMKSWPLLRAYFMSGEVDLAYIICPMAMDMFREKPNFRWVSLRPDLKVINYKHLNIDQGGLKQVMDLAVEAGILKKRISISAFADESFGTEVTEKAD